MKNLLILLLLVFASCNDNEKRTDPDEIVPIGGQDTVAERDLPPGNIQRERDALQTRKIDTLTQNDLAGRYQNLDQNETPREGRCDYLEVRFDDTTEMCIVHEKIYVEARFEKTGNNTADIYFAGLKKDEDPDRDLPWERINKDEPIAVLSLLPGGNAQVEWKGFSIEGERSTAYEDLGKRTLEGTYKKLQ